MQTALKYFVFLFGAVCMVIGLVHIAIGPAAIPGSIPVNATMDSEDRFYATLFVGYGAAVIWCGSALHDRGKPFFWLMLLFFCTGVSRLVSIVQVGLPHSLFQFLSAVELIQPIGLWLWYRSAYPASSGTP